MRAENGLQKAPTAEVGLAPLAALAKRFDVAIVLIAHRRKSKAGTADDSTLGGVGFTGIARNTHHLFEDPDRPGRKLLLPGKNNVGPPQSGLGFRLAMRVEATVPAVAWDREPVHVSADELIAGLARGEGRRVRRGATEDWLGELLAAGPMGAGEVQEKAKQAGLEWRTVQGACRVLGIRPRKTGFGAGSSWEWRLPDHEDDPAKTFEPIDDLGGGGDEE